MLIGKHVKTGTTHDYLQISPLVFLSLLLSPGMSIRMFSISETLESKVPWIRESTSGQ